MSPRLETIGRWILWIGMLGLTASVLLWARGDIDQSHVALTLLLVVLGGSAGGGRPLGFLLAFASFLLIDYSFQPAYGSLFVDKPLDWVVLVAFVAAAFVTTELVARARGEADTARQRGDEMALVSRLGAETLRYAVPEEALSAIAELVQGTLHTRRTAIRLMEPSGALAHDTLAMAGATASITEHQVMEWVATISPPDRIRDAAAVLPDGSVSRGLVEDVGDELPLNTLVLPLVIEARRVGMMVIDCSNAPRTFSPADRRFLSALGYYAALGAERVRLAREAEYAKALRQENRAKDEVLAAVSHDLRTPLTTVKLLAQNVANRGDPDGAVIEEQADRLAALVTNVLDLSRIRAGGVTLDMELNTAEDLVGAAITRAKGLTIDKHIVPHIDFDAPALTGRFDFVQSLRVLGNLLDNALRYTPPHSVVDLRVARDGPWIAISVADSGPGVPSAERERIFEPFYRPRSDVPDAGHAGLGLSIAKRLAELQHGSITYTPRTGGGSIFTFRLPFVEALEPAASLDE